MKNRALVIVAAIVGLVMGGGLVATAATTGHAGLKGSGSPALAPSIFTSMESKFSPIAPCRMVDTRKSGGPVSSPRTFRALASSFADQGGSPTACGIPTAVVAIQADVVAVGASGSGFLKAYPADGGVPVSSYLNFRDGTAIANGGVIPLSTDGLGRFTVSASRATQVVVDVTGYYVMPIWAEVQANGTAVQSSLRLQSVGRPATGQYQVLFDRDISSCALSVSGLDASHIIGAQHSAANADEALVSTASPDGAADDAGFFIDVTC